MISTTSQDGGSRAYRAGMAVLALSSFLVVWTSIVRDDGGAAAYFMILMAAAVGTFATRFQPDGMARTMLGLAVMQTCLGALTVTAPVTATMPDGVFKAALYNSFFAALWLISMVFFRRAVSKQTGTAD